MFILVYQETFEFLVLFLGRAYRSLVARMGLPWSYKLKARFASNEDNLGRADSAELQPASTAAVAPTKTGDIDVEASHAGIEGDDKLRPDSHAQAGVQAAEAVTISWTKRALAGAFAK